MPNASSLSSEAEVTALLAAFARADGTAAQSIAVVGSSGSLLFRGFGSEIDEHDVVVRVNGAVTEGYEHDCGRASSHTRATRTGRRRRRRSRWRPVHAA